MLPIQLEACSTVTLCPCHERLIARELLARTIRGVMELGLDCADNVGEVAVWRLKCSWSRNPCFVEKRIFARLSLKLEEIGPVVRDGVTSTIRCQLYLLRPHNPDRHHRGVIVT